MKRFLQILALVILINSCGSNDSVVFIDDIIVDDWTLLSQKIDGSETITDCTKSTTFSFRSNGVLRQVFYGLLNGECIVVSQPTSNWLVEDNSEYRIEEANGNIRIIKIFFSDNDNKFSLEETDENGKNIVSIFQRS
ncbi:lipocalin family protein [Polaribacter porphyrae]|uniref:Lipocalin-like domain-containing protein n=1 Tax=Polaribacter porphyrae TaxID=1137780 RepID=A0A2S7WJW5_9FLAO|nr:lipocalin family protein [Polaribacter porphyrae]PQJ77898.1 hypothetical protein BTO18_01280 [Polaribacter porphyrae]